MPAAESLEEAVPHAPYVDERPAGTTAVAVVGSAANETNLDLVARWRELGLDARLVAGHGAPALLRPDDVALGRLDVVATLDGVEPGLLGLLLLERRGVRVLNTAYALLGAHDKLVTARRLAAAGVPHPRTVHVPPRGPAPRLEPPLVLKPRFGSWGRDVLRCADHRELARALAAIADRPWFRRHGVLAQELLPSERHDLRLLVAGGAAVGSAERTAAPGEWRTNVSLGGSIRHVDADADAVATGVAAARAIGADAMGIDLLRTGGRWVVLELNGAVDFGPEYALPGRDVYADLARALGLPVG